MLDIVPVLLVDMGHVVDFSGQKRDRIGYANGRTGRFDGDGVFSNVVRVQTCNVAKHLDEMNVAAGLEVDVCQDWSGTPWRRALDYGRRLLRQPLSSGHIAKDIQIFAHEGLELIPLGALRESSNPKLQSFAEKRLKHWRAS